MDRDNRVYMPNWSEYTSTNDTWRNDTMVEPASDVYGCAFMRDWSGLLKRLKTHPQDAAWSSKSNGKALHIACGGNPPPEVLEALIAAYPDAVRQSCRAYENRGRYDQRRIPLFLACENGASYEALRVILLATPTTKMGYKAERSYWYKNPLDFLHAYYSSKYVGTFGRDFGGAIKSPNDLTGERGEFWQKAALLLDHARRGVTNERPLDPANPVLILQAAASVKANSFSFSWNVEGLIQRLLPEVPMLISKRAHVPDEGGRFLLHTAIDCGLGWEDGVGDIAKAAPWAVSVRDEETGLYPFMLAVVTTGVGAQEENTDSLTLIWGLLLEDPSLVSVSSQS